MGGRGGVRGRGGRLKITFVIILITVIVISTVKVVTVDGGPIMLRKRVRTARVQVSKGLPNEVSAFLIQRKRCMGVNSALIIVGDPRT